MGSRNLPWKRGAGVVLAASCSLLMLMAASPVGHAQTSKGKTFKVGQRTLRCGKIPTVFDPNLPMEGAAILGEALVLNPALMNRQPETVRLFVFHHECGHHVVGGGTEMGADCHAAEEGVRDGWLDRAGVDTVCRSLGNEPASSTHPSGQRRCKNIVKCFNNAMAKLPPATATKPTVTAAKPADTASTPAPKAFRLLSGPKLVAEGVARETPRAPALCPPSPSKSVAAFASASVAGPPAPPPACK